MHISACTGRAGQSTHTRNQSGFLCHWGDAMNLLANSLSLLAWPSHEWEEFLLPPLKPILRCEICKTLRRAVHSRSTSSSACVPEMHRTCVCASLLHCGWCFVQQSESSSLLGCVLQIEHWVDLGWVFHTDCGWVQQSPVPNWWLHYEKIEEATSTSRDLLTCCAECVESKLFDS